jgi:hypothetical protein
MSKIPGDNGSSLNSFQAIEPLTAHKRKGYIFKGAYFPQKLTPKTSTEPRYKLFHGRVSFYILNRNKGCFVRAAPILL